MAIVDHSRCWPLAFYPAVATSSGVFELGAHDGKLAVTNYRQKLCNEHKTDPTTISLPIFSVINSGVADKSSFTAAWEQKLEYLPIFASLAQ